MSEALGKGCAFAGATIAFTLVGVAAGAVIGVLLLLTGVVHESYGPGAFFILPIFTGEGASSAGSSASSSASGS